jgi:heme exporter protein B
VVRGRTRQAALPVLVLPLVSPVIIAATRATATLTQGSTSGIGGWLSLLAAFDAAFLAIGYVVFGHLLED